MRHASSGLLDKAHRAVIMTFSHTTSYHCDVCDGTVIVHKDIQTGQVFDVQVPAERCPTPVDCTNSVTAAVEHPVEPT